MTPIAGILAARRVSMTSERKLLCEKLETIPDHFDAEEFYLKLRGDGVRVSRATLYRTLDLLVSAGYLRRLAIERGKARYERLEGKPLHGHLVCSVCGRVIDFPLPDVEELRRKAMRRHGFRVEMPELTLAGKCRSCRK